MAVVAVLALAATTMIGVSSASAAALTNTTWSVSNNQTGAPAVTYTFELTTATSDTIKTVTATVPTDTAGTVGAGTVYGLGAGTAAFTPGTPAEGATEATLGLLTYTVTSPVTVGIGIPIYIEFPGLTNTSTATPAVTSTVTTNNATVAIDTATSSSVSFGAASTAVTVQIPKSLTFTNDTPSFNLQLDPSLEALTSASKAVTLTVTTNAGQGYTLAAKDTGLTMTSGLNSYTIAAASTSVATGVDSLAANTFGVSAVLTNGGKSEPVIQGVGLNVTGNFVGYTTGGEPFLAATKPTGTGTDTLVLTNKVKINYDAAAGTYTDSITYTAAPVY